MNYETLKVGDVLLHSCFILVVDRIFGFDNKKYYDCRFFYDFRDMMSRTIPHLVTLTVGGFDDDFDRFGLKKIDV
jgi:hypothetical protein